ncbi:MAG: HlyC/CorC family transporter [Pseudomonadota bacterium]
MLIYYSIAILVLLLLSALCSGTETAMTGASRAEIHHRASGGNRRARLVERMMENREGLIGALLLGNNIFNILAASLATSLFLNLAGEAGVAVATFVMTVLVVIFAEVLPKTYAIRHAERMATFIAPLAWILVVVLRPATRIIQWIVAGLIRLFRMDNKGADMVSVVDELRSTLALYTKSGELAKHERDMLGGVLDLGEVEVATIMTHRSQMDALDAEAPIDDIIAAVRDSPYSRLPVWRGNPDQIIGILHAKDLLRVLNVEKTNRSAIDLAELMQDPWFVPETTPLRLQLTAFRQRRSHLAIVVDEYGTIMGLVTLEDILEEIVGEIDDETDTARLGITRENNGSAVVEGQVPVRDINRYLDWRLPDEEAATIAGLVMHHTRRMPKEGELIRIQGYRIKILKRQRQRLLALRITPTPQEVH